MPVQSFRRFRPFTASHLLTVCLLFGLTSNALAATMMRIAVPGVYGTSPTGINNGGEIVGYTWDPYTAISHGFLRSADGTYTTFDVPNSDGTIAVGINATGEVAGVYLCGGCSFGHGFVRATNGTITTFDAPNAVSTTPTAIGGNGSITGYFSASDATNGAFIRFSNGTFVTFAVPNATWTNPTGINSAGDVVGYAPAPGGSRLGFMRTSAGVMTTFVISSDAPETVPYGINDFGTITGHFGTKYTYGDFCVSGCLSKGFLLTSTGAVTSFEVPLDFPIGTYPVSINNKGEVTGYYRQIYNSVSHGFVRDTTGKITTFDFGGPFGVASPVSINDSGVVTGVAGTVGFVRFP